MLEILAARRRGLGVSRIGEVGRIVDAGPILLDLDFAFEFSRDAVKLGDHRLDLGDLSPFLVDLKFLQPDESFA